MELREKLGIPEIPHPIGIKEIRRSNLRALIAKTTAVKLAAQLGYRQSSYLSEMAGPNPKRPLTEKSARRFEEQLSLAPGWFDADHSAPKPVEPAPAPPTAEAPVQSAAATATAELVADVIRLVGSVCASEAVSLPPIKFADVVALAYIDMMEHAGQPREPYVKQLVRLLK